MANFPHTKISKVNKRPQYRVGSNIKRFRQLPKLKLHTDETNDMEKSHSKRKAGRVKK